MWKVRKQIYGLSILQSQGKERDDNMRPIRADASPCGDSELYGLIYAMRNCFCEPCMYDDPDCELGRKCGLDREAE